MNISDVKTQIAQLLDIIPNDQNINIVSYVKTLFDNYVSYARIEYIVTTVIAFVALCASIYGIYHLWKKCKTKNDGRYELFDDMIDLIIVLVCGSALIISFIFVMVNIFDIVQLYVNPDSFIIEKIFTK